MRFPFHRQALYQYTLVVVDSSILLTDIVFDLTWVPGLKNQKGADFHNFSRKIDSNVSVKVFLCFVYLFLLENGHTIISNYQQSSSRDENYCPLENGI